MLLVGKHHAGFASNTKPHPTPGEIERECQRSILSMGILNGIRMRRGGGSGIRCMYHCCAGGCRRGMCLFLHLISMALKCYLRSLWALILLSLLFKIISLDICDLPSETGPCKVYIPSYYYNADGGKCESFIYVEEMKTGLRHLQSVNRNMAQLPLPVMIIFRYGQPRLAILAS